MINLNTYAQVLKHSANIISIIKGNVIFIGLNGLAILDFVPNRLSLASYYFINNISKQLEINADAYEFKKIKKVVYLHFDNVSIIFFKSCETIFQRCLSIRLNTGYRRSIGIR